MLKTHPSAAGSAGGARIGLALAGGGPLGITYEIGAVHALAEALEGVDLNDLMVYVGVSAGAVVASSLANQITPAQMCRIFVRNESQAFPLNPEQFLKPAYAEYRHRLGRIPLSVVRAVRDMLRHPTQQGVIRTLNAFASVLPSGVFSNVSIHEFLQYIFSSRGRSNDFRKLKHRLYIVAARLDTGESVRFGAQGHDHVPISKAVQASTALPGLYPPVEIEGELYVDGALQRTLHASAALDDGADLLLCINPIVPVDVRLTGDKALAGRENLADGGLVVVLAQTFRALIHSRMKVGMAQYDERFADRDVVLFEPNPGDARMFFTNVFSFANRRRVCEHAYQTTRRDLLARRDELEPMFAKHGIRLRTEILDDPNRHFDTDLSIPASVSALGRRRNRVTNDLSATLDELESYLGKV